MKSWKVLTSSSKGAVQFSNSEQIAFSLYTTIQTPTYVKHIMRVLTIAESTLMSNFIAAEVRHVISLCNAKAWVAELFYCECFVVTSEL